MPFRVPHARHFSANQKILWHFRPFLKLFVAKSTLFKSLCGKIDGELFSAVKQNIHFCLIPSSEFLPAISQFPVRVISGSFLETLCEVLGMFDLRLCVSLHLNKTTNQSNIVFFHWAPL